MRVDKRGDCVTLGDVAFRRAQSEEQKTARVAEKQQQTEAKARQKAVADEQTRWQREAAERERQRQAFLSSPAGNARAAFERGDRLFQFFMDVKDTKPVVIPMAGATTKTMSADPVAILNSVCNEGWELVNGSFVFHELGAESRDKFLSSGQNVAVRGTIIGYYLFRRSEEAKRQTRDPWDIPPMERACPHCGEAMNAAAKFCPHCQTESQPWQFAHGFWWRSVGEDWHYYDNGSREWKKQVRAAEPGGENGG